MAIDLSKYNNPAPRQSKNDEKSFTGKAMDLMNKDITLFKSGLNDAKKERFFSDLHVLLSSGIDIKSAFELIVEEEKKKNEKELFGKIKTSLLNGSSLTESLEQTGQFNKYEYFSIKIGEETGRLSQVLHELAKYYEGKIAQKRQFISVLTYPSIVFVTAIGITFFMLNVVVPNFADLFKRFGSELPYLTRTIMKASNWFASWFWLVMLVMGVIILSMYVNRKQLWFRKATSNLVLKIPVLSELIKRVYLARFCHSMNLLISAKTPLTEAIDMVRQMIGFYPIEQSLYRVKEGIMKGMPLHEVMKEFPIYNSRMISLIKVAAEVNQLETIFRRLSEQYTQEVGHQTKVLNT